MNRTSLSIVFLFVLVAITAGLGWLGQDSAPQKPSEAGYMKPNYQASHMRTRLYDTQGQLTHRIEAQSMEHYDELGFTNFRQPNYWIFIDNEPEPWQVEAQEATLYTDQRLHLDGEVALNNASAQGYVNTIRTDFMSVTLDKKQLQSDQPVTIEGDNFVIQSRGIVADLNQQSFELMDHVHTRYHARP